MSALTAGQKKIILIVAAIVLLLVSYFLIFQNNMQRSSELSSETAQLNTEIDRLTQLQAEVNQMRGEAKTQQEVVNEFTYSFPCKLEQEGAIYYVYRMMVKSGITINSIGIGADQTMVTNGKYVPFDGRSYEGVNVPTVDPNAEKSQVELDPQTRVPLNEMVGKTVGYTLSISGTEKEIYKAINWVENNEKPMSVTNLSLSYDSTTGKLSGTMMVYFHSMNGNGMTYDDPVDVDDFDIGPDNIFGILKKGNN